MKCPSCLSRLSRTESGQVVFICDQCGTRSVSLEELRATLSPLVFRQIQNKNHILKKSSKFDCPQCTQALFSMSTKHRGEEVEIDLCSSCKLVWFDIGELEHFLEEKHLQAMIPEEVLQKLQEIDTRRGKSTPRYMSFNIVMKDFGVLPVGRAGLNWRGVPALFGLPVENQNRLSKTPWVTWVLALSIFLISLYELFIGGQEFVNRWGFYANDPFGDFGFSAFSSLFLHADLGHLMGNLYFLWLFGDNSEDSLGFWGYIFLLLTAVALSQGLYAIGAPRGDIPLIGVSGVVSALIAYYSLRFPRVRFFNLLGFFWWLKFPAIAYVAFWVILQFIGLQQQIAGVTSVSYLSHLGGFAAGLLFGLAARYGWMPKKY